MNNQNINRISILKQLLIDNGISSRGDKTYFSLSKISKQYFNLTVAEFISSNCTNFYQEKGKKSYYISPANLLPCLEKSKNQKAIKLLNDVDDIVNAKAQKNLQEASEKLKAIDRVVSVSDHIEHINKKIIEDANIIPNVLTGVGKNPIKLDLISADDPEFCAATKCPTNTHLVFKKLSIPLFKFVQGDEITYYIRHAMMIKYFPMSNFTTSMIDLLSDTIDNGSIVTFDDDEDHFDFESERKKVKYDDMTKFNSIDDKFFAKLKTVASKNPFIYSMQRQLWPNDKSFFENATKKYEFEMLHIILMKTSDIFYFDFQKRIGSYSLDALLYRKGHFDKQQQTICVEVDEDNHKDRNQDNEDLKTNYIKSCGHAVFRFPISRTSTSEQIELAATDAVKEILDFSKKNVIMRSPQPILDSIKVRVIDNNVQDEFVKLFFKKITNRPPPFIYNHFEVGEYIGYSSERNYDSFRSSIRDKYVKGVDYVEFIENNVAVIYMSATTFNFICSDSPLQKAKKISRDFVTVYQLAYEYLLTLIEINNGTASHIHYYADDDVMMKEAKKIIGNRIAVLNKDYEAAKKVLIKRYDDIIESHNVIHSSNTALTNEIHRLMQNEKSYIEQIEAFEYDIINKSGEIELLQLNLLSARKEAELAISTSKKLEVEKHNLMKRIVEKDTIIAAKDAIIAEKDIMAAEKDAEIARLTKLLDGEEKTVKAHKPAKPPKAKTSSSSKTSHKKR